uniref:Uncharacterized protein n=1 Tax=Candidozyma auris TaxID=498019 RepID=A0A0L0P2V9_CANAR
MTQFRADRRIVLSYYSYRCYVDTDTERISDTNLEISGDVNIANESEICKRLDSAESKFGGTSELCLDKKILL